MKKIFLLFCIIYLTTLSYAQNTLIGKWKVVAMEKENEKLPLEENALREFMYTKALEEKGKDSTLNKEDSANIEMTIPMILRTIGNMTLTFASNKTLTITYSKKKEVENYVYNATTKILTSTDKKKKVKKFYITLSSKELILDNKGEEGKMYLQRMQ